MKAKLVPNGRLDVAHHDTITLLQHPGDLGSEASGAHLGKIKATRPNYSTARKVLLGEKGAEKELQQLMTKLQEALALQAQPGKSSHLPDSEAPKSMFCFVDLLFRISF